MADKTTKNNTDGDQPMNIPIRAADGQYLSAVSITKGIKQWRPITVFFRPIGLRQNGFQQGAVTCLGTPMY